MFNLSLSNGQFPEVGKVLFALKTHIMSITTEIFQFCVAFLKCVYKRLFYKVCNSLSSSTWFLFWEVMFD